MDSLEKLYFEDLERIDHSGPHQIGPEQQSLNNAVFDAIRDLLPIDDIHKHSDCDLIYRFLIACRWHVNQACSEMRDYVTWRRENRLNEILWETIPAEVNEAMPFFQGVDRFGCPMFFDRPDPALIGRLLQSFPREQLLRGHLTMMEQGRRLCKSMNIDRVSCILDLSMLNMSIVTNPKAIGLLKEFSRMDQKYYPENMRTMILTNSGWTFSTLYKVIRPVLDERVQKKIQVLRGGPQQKEQIAVWVDLAQVPVEYGGTAERSYELPMALDIRGVAPGTSPCTSDDKKIK